MPRPTFTRTLTVLLLLVAARADAAGSRDEATALELVNRGAELFHGGDFERALAAFTAAHAIVPDKANPYRWMGECEARLGQWQAAVAHLDHFLESVAPTDNRIAAVTAVRDQAAAQLKAQEDAAAAAKPAAPTAPVAAPSLEARPQVALAGPVAGAPTRSHAWVWGVLGAVALVAAAVGVGFALAGTSSAPPESFYGSFAAMFR